MVVQTSTATAAQQVTIHVAGGLPARVVHVWSTNLRGPGQFIRRGDIVSRNGVFAALLRPGYVRGVLTQTAAGEPVEWQYPGRSPAPYAIVGRNTWRDYTVSARVVLPASGPEAPAARRRADRTLPGVLGVRRRNRGKSLWPAPRGGPTAGP
jgi:hypothetical protein